MAKKIGERVARVKWQEDDMERAIEIESVEWVRELLAAGHPVDALFRQNLVNVTPLYRACEKSSIDLCKILLDAGANIDFQTGFGRTCLHVAIEVRDEVLLQFLVERGARIDIPDVRGRTPLRLAIDDENVDAVKILTKAGADPAFMPANAASDFRTPFQTAVTVKPFSGKPALSSERADIISHLVLQCGVDPDPVGASTCALDGATLQDISMGNAQMLALLSSLKTQRSVYGVLPSGQATARVVKRDFSPL
jgi:ankyrin repeat protein